MIVYDCIFGKFDLPDFLRILLSAPEFRRLSEVRLININSPSLSSLSDARRYSHTLGVLRLALENPLLGFDEEEHKALLAAIIVHDAATPAFAHLFEYFLSDRFNWNHEVAIPDLLSGRGNTDFMSTQIYYSLPPKFSKLCMKSRIDFDIVMSIVRGKHPLSRLVFGSIDFDNLDNVSRMNWMLGYRFDIQPILRLAGNFGVGGKASLLLPKDLSKDLEYWLELRERAYKILVFDQPTVSAQAILSKAIQNGLEEGDLNLDDWLYPDHVMIETLRNCSTETKIMLEKDFLGPLPSMCLLHHFQDTESPVFELDRDDVVGLVEEFLASQDIGGRVYGYCFRDRGAFSKEIDAVDPSSGEAWSIGTQSDSLVVYGFTSKKGSFTPRELGKRFEAWVHTQ